MDNYQIQQPQPVQAAAGQNNMPPVRQIQTPIDSKKDTSGLIKTIIIIVVSLIAVTFIGLFIWKQLEYVEVQTDVQGQIDAAVAAAKDEQTIKMEAEFLEREKHPYKTFSGPVDYGQLTFEYPKTWSVYIEEDAASGGDFEAYFNPNQVDKVNRDTINALRVTIQNKNFEDVAASYQRDVERKDSGLTMQAVTFNGINGNRYDGNIPGTDLQGSIVIFKIRDKTAILQTDSKLFENDFNNLLETVVFNA